MSVDATRVITTAKDLITPSMSQKEQLAILVAAISDVQLETKNVTMELANMKNAFSRHVDAINRLLESKDKPKDVMPPPRPPEPAPRQRGEWKWMPTNREAFPNSIAEELAPFDTAPENIKSVARNQETFDGYKYWISNNQRWIYRRRA